MLLKDPMLLFVFYLTDVKRIELKSAHVMVDLCILLVIMSIFAFYSCGEMLRIY